MTFTSNQDPISGWACKIAVRMAVARSPITSGCTLIYSSQNIIQNSFWTFGGYQVTTTLSASWDAIAPILGRLCDRDRRQQPNTNHLSRNAPLSLKLSGV